MGTSFPDASGDAARLDADCAPLDGAHASTQAAATHFPRVNSARRKRVIFQAPPVAASYADAAIPFMTSVYTEAPRGFYRPNG
jgi:hypothetical protein